MGVTGLATGKQPVVLASHSLIVGRDMMIANHSPV